MVYDIVDILQTHDILQLESSCVPMILSTIPIYKSRLDCVPRLCLFLYNILADNCNLKSGFLPK